MVIKYIKYIAILLFTYSIALSNDSVLPTNESPEVLMEIEKLKERSEEINKGFLFFKGEYILAPYSVSIDEGTLLINKVKIKKLINWPIYVPSKSRPIIPAKVIQNAKSFNDLKLNDDRISWTSMMYCWILRNVKGIESKKNKLRVFYESLPFVKKVNFSKKNRMIITLTSGKIIKGSISKPRPALSKEDALKKLLSKKDYYIQKLKEGSTIIYTFNLSEKIITPEKSAKYLKLMVETLEAEYPPEEKVKKLSRLNIYPQKLNTKSCLISSFKSSDQLNERIESLNSSTGIKPITEDQLPVFTEKEMTVLYEKYQDRKEMEEKKRKKNSININKESF